MKIMKQVSDIFIPLQKRLLHFHCFKKNIVYNCLFQDLIYFYWQVKLTQILKRKKSQNKWGLNFLARRSGKFKLKLTYTITNSRVQTWTKVLNLTILMILSVELGLRVKLVGVFTHSKNYNLLLVMLHPI